jgi:transposase InsO family protein/transposase-like protein
MYSREEKTKAIELYIKYNKRNASVIRELGYPSRKLLPIWYKEYIENNNSVKDKYTRKLKYSKSQRTIAVEYYLNHGKNISDTVKHLGYPCRTVLSNWIEEDVPNHRISCLKGKPLIKYSLEEKKSSVIDLSIRTGTAKEVSDQYGATKCSIYGWRKKLLSSEGLSIMKTRKENRSIKDVDEAEEIAKLKKEIDRLRLEKDILKEAIKLIKKEMGIDVDCLSNKEKTIIINALRYRYNLTTLMEILNISKSSYFYQNNTLKKAGKYREIRKIITTIFHDNFQSYGYRRIHANLKNMNIYISEKVVRKLMIEEKLKVITIKKKKYSSYLGEISPEVDNIIKRNFSSNNPNTKMLTDITEFRIPAGKVYLSPLIDCFDGMVSSWSISTSPSSQLVNSMLNNYINNLKQNEQPLIHSDRGAHYRWPEWINIMDNANLTRSMSKKGCSPDNSACEGFFGRLKNEMFYKRDWSNISIESFINQLNQYIHWYNSKRIKMSLGGMSPTEYRLSLGIN